MRGFAITFAWISGAMFVFSSSVVIDGICWGRGYLIQESPGAKFGHSVWNNFAFSKYLFTTYGSKIQQKW